MPEVEDECTFYTTTDQIKFRTQTNGDEIRIRGIDLSQDQAASLAWLVNADGAVELEISIKIKGT